MNPDPSDRLPTPAGRHWLYLCRRCGRTAPAGPADAAGGTDRWLKCCGEVMLLTLQDRRPDRGPAAPMPADGAEGAPGP